MHDRVLVEQLVGFFIVDDGTRFLDGQLAHLGLVARRAPPHLLQCSRVDAHGLVALRAHDTEGGRRRVADLDFDHAPFHETAAQVIAQSHACLFAFGEVLWRVVVDLVAVIEMLAGLLPAAGRLR